MHRHHPSPRATLGNDRGPCALRHKYERCFREGYLRRGGGVSFLVNPAPVLGGRPGSSSTPTLSPREVGMGSCAGSSLVALVPLAIFSTKPLSGAVPWLNGISPPPPPAHIAGTPRAQ